VRRTRSAGSNGIGAPDRRQLGHEIVERRKAASSGVAQHRIERTLGLAREQGDAHRLRLLEIRVDTVEHAEHAGDVKAADTDLDPTLAQRPGKVERAWKLIRLDTHEHHHAAAGGGDQLGEAGGAYA
jgi:hypothetical protein